MNGLDQRALTDTHAHLSLVRERLGAEILVRMFAAYEAAADGGDAPFIVDPGVDPGDFPARKRDFGGLRFVKLAAGIWPAREPLGNPLPVLRELAADVADPACVAVGECGLDYRWMNGDVGAQRILFEGQLSLASRERKPVIVHSREAREDTLAILRSADPGIPVIIHCFGYDLAAARDFLELGCFISFAGNATYASARGVREAAAFVPADHLLLETDAPYMGPAPARGMPCTPLDVSRTYAEIARLRGMDPDELARSVLANARIVFGG
ncbi:MAG: TatD family hydrolase [Spirochaetes bacterium]|nr:TatD family hydrolase [Spirochaetota bacterium]